MKYDDPVTYKSAFSILKSIGSSAVPEKVLLPEKILSALFWGTTLVSMLIVRVAVKSPPPVKPVPAVILTAE